MRSTGVLLVQLGTPDDLPPQRRDQYDKSRRMSKVLVKKL